MSFHVDLFSNYRQIYGFSSLYHFILGSMNKSSKNFNIEKLLSINTSSSTHFKVILLYFNSFHMFTLDFHLNWANCIHIAPRFTCWFLKLQIGNARAYHFSHRIQPTKENHLDSLHFIISYTQIVEFLLKPNQLVQSFLKKI